MLGHGKIDATRDLIEAQIKSLGANRVDKAATGKEGLLKLKKSLLEGIPYALVTLDWEMPEMSGLELLKIIRADEDLRSQLVLMVTSMATPEHLRQLVPLQPSGYIVKPFTPELLKERIRNLLASEPGGG